MIDLLANGDALRRIAREDIVALTRNATDSSFYRDDLDAQQLAENARIVAMSGDDALSAIESDERHFVAAFADDQFAGFMIATRHGPDSRELDWLMVDPGFHGSGIARALMEAGIEWLDREQPQWLNVIHFNQRAIAFYRKFGFEIDPKASNSRLVRNVIMRRPASV